MSLSLDARTFADMLADPAAAESLSAVASCPLITIEVPDAAAARPLAGLQVTTLPAVVALIVPDPGCLPAAAADAADVILTEDSRAPDPFAAAMGGPATAVARIDATLAGHPIAGTALAMLLRISAALPVPAAVVAESAAYSALQAGAEFLAWRDVHPPRPPSPEDVAERVLIERDDTTVRIVLNRPARRNAVDYRMRDALVAALVAAIDHADLQVELRGSGLDFCAGGDLDEFGSRPDPAQAHLIRLTRSPALLLHRLANRTTAVLHGSCLGAGIELPAFAGRVIASPDTRIALPEIRLGLIPGAGGTVSVTRRVGRWRTALLALTGDTIDAAQALRWGLIDAIELPDELE